MRAANIVLSICIFFFNNFCYASESLIIEPEMGRAPLLNAISNAQQSVDLVMYGLTDEQFTHALINAQTNHKNVRILLQHYPYLSTDENERAINELQAAHMNLHWPDDKFKLTHQKTFLLDGNKALVLTFNLTHSSFTKERNFGLLITDPNQVAKIQRVFDADFAHANENIQDVDLIFSPDDSREKLLALIRQAHTSLNIYAEGLSDYQIVGALAKAARHGVQVNILTSLYNKKPAAKQFGYLERAGVNIHFSKRYLIHAKVMIIDDNEAVLGSINFTRQSINNNRELSVITHDPAIIKQLSHTFINDWHDSATLATTPSATYSKSRDMRPASDIKPWVKLAKHYLKSLRLS
jgi:cardiolipin synthase A/B